MAKVGNKWSLFGLDLTRWGKWLALGFHQLMYDHGAWLLQRFDPSIRVTRGGEALWYRADAPLGEGIAADEQTPFSAVLAISGYRHASGMASGQSSRKRD